MNVYVESLGAGDAGDTKASSDDCRVRGLSSTGGENRLRCEHAVHVVGIRLVSDENNFLAKRDGNDAALWCLGNLSVLGEVGRVGVEDYLSDRSTGRCRQSN